MNKLFGMKICLLGDGFVGKTSIKRRYLGMKFKSTYMATIGADFSLKEQEYTASDPNDSSTNHTIVIKYLIWDLAGQEKYSNIRASYFMGAKGVMLVYDCTNKSSFENLDNWLNEFSRTVKEKFPIILIANKIDLREDGVTAISTKEGNARAIELSKQFDTTVHFLETSAKTGENVNEAFNTLSAVLYDSHISKILNK